MKQEQKPSFLSRFFAHRATRVILFGVTAVLFTGWLLNYASQNGGITSGLDGGASITWLSVDNAQSSLNISQDASGLKAAPKKTILLVECVPANCNSADLNLSDVSKKFNGEVVVLAIDPYDQAKLDKILHSKLMDDNIANFVAVQMAARVLAQQGKPMTMENAQALANNPQFMQVVGQQLQALVRPAYPKFYVFEKDTFQLLGMTEGLANEAQVVAFVKQAITPPTEDAAPTQVAPAAPNAPVVAPGSEKK